jgi:hypothetical protein
MHYGVSVIHLTKQEQWVMFTLATLLLMGWAVKAYRTAHPPAAVPGQSPIAQMK